MLLQFSYKKNTQLLIADAILLRGQTLESHLIPVPQSSLIRHTIPILIQSGCIRASMDKKDNMYYTVYVVA